jgi:hypothetical protein
MTVPTIPFTFSPYWRPKIVLAITDGSGDELYTTSSNTDYDLCLVVSTL